MIEINSPFDIALIYKMKSPVREVYSISGYGS